MFNLSGIEVVVDKYLCKIKFVRWRKSHRKARINKKWHKKYGYISKCINDQVINCMGKLIICPCMENELRKLNV